MREWRSLWIELGLEMGAFATLVGCVSLLWRHNLPLLVIASTLGIVALTRWHARFDVCLFLVIAVLGTLAEAVFVRFGVWEYANPTVLGVPIWFPLAFGTTGLIGGRLARTLAVIWDQASPPGGARA